MARLVKKQISTHKSALGPGSWSGWVDACAEAFIGPNPGIIGPGYTTHLFPRLVRVVILDRTWLSAMPD